MQDRLIARDGCLIPSAAKGPDASPAVHPRLFEEEHWHAPTCRRHPKRLETEITVEIRGNSAPARIGFDAVLQAPKIDGGDAV